MQFFEVRSLSYILLDLLLALAQKSCTKNYIRLCSHSIFFSLEQLNLVICNRNPMGVLGFLLRLSQGFCLVLECGLAPFNVCVQ